MTAAAMLGLAGAAGYAYRHAPPVGVERWLHAEIVELSDEELAPWLTGLLARRGERAIPLVVGDLASQRPAVRRAALQALRLEIDRWETNPAQAPQSATVMAEAIRDLPSATRETAGAELGTRLLVWADRAGLPSASRGRIRVALAGLTPRAPTRWMASSVVRQASETGVTAPPLPAPVPPSSSPGETTASVAARTNSASSAGSPASRVAVESPRLLPPVEAGRAAAWDDESWELTPRGSSAGSETPSPEPALPAAPVPNAAEEIAAVQGTATRQLIAGLHGERRDEFVQELRRRGFDEESIELAEHLSSADVKERLQWTAALPQIAKIDARAWLTWMTEDANAEVRRTAVTLLATSLDEPTLALLRQLAVRDPDPAVRRFAGELIRRQ